MLHVTCLLVHFVIQFGFQFAEHLATEHDEAHLGWDFTNEKEVAYYPPMECSAPEMMISNVMTRKSDVFSIGRVCYILQRQQSGIRREAVIESADQFRRFINDLSVRKEAIPWQGIPETLLPALKRALVCDEKARCNVTDIVNCQYLNDLMVRVIRYLDKLLDKERDGKIKFLKKLPEVIRVDAFWISICFILSFSLSIFPRFVSVMDSLLRMLSSECS